MEDPEGCMAVHVTQEPDWPAFGWQVQVAQTRSWTSPFPPDRSPFPVTQTWPPVDVGLEDPEPESS